MKMLLNRDVKNHRIIVRCYSKVQLKTALHQSKYVLLKSENDLTQEQQLKLEAINKFHHLGADALLERRFERYLKVHKIGQMGLSVLDWLASAKKRL